MQLCHAYRAAKAMSYQAVKTACQYNVQSRRYLGASTVSKNASNVRADSEEVTLLV